MYGFSQQVTACVVRVCRARLLCRPPLRQEAPCKNAADGDIMKAKFVFIPACHSVPIHVIALHQYARWECELPRKAR
jgi:hypothetical protein